jgi:hypothetical protein
VRYTFESLRGSADLQLAAVQAGDGPDTQTGADAVLVAATLFDWIAVNIPDEAKRADVARRVAIALNLETA